MSVSQGSTEPDSPSNLETREGAWGHLGDMTSLMGLGNIFLVPLNIFQAQHLPPCLSPTTDGVQRTG